MLFGQVFDFAGVVANIKQHPAVQVNGSTGRLQRNDFPAVLDITAIAFKFKVLVSALGGP